MTKMQGPGTILRGLRRRSRRGFTLIEVMVSATVLGVVAVGVAPLMSGLNSTLHDAASAQQATRLGQQLVERIQAMPIANVEGLCNRYPPPATNGSGSIKQDPISGESYQQSCSASTLDGGKVMTISLKWTSSEGANAGGAFGRVKTFKIYRSQ